MKLPASPALLCCLGFVATGGRADGLAAANGNSCTGPGEEEPDASSKLKNTIKELKKKLSSSKSEIRALIGDPKLELEKGEMRGHVKALHRDFFNALEKSRLYPSLDRKTKTKILAMSSRSFRKKLVEWYNECNRVYDDKNERYSAEKKDLESQIEREKKRSKKYRSDKEKTSKSRKKLKALKSSLEKCGEKCHKYSIKPQICEGHYDEIKSLSRKVLGESSVSALYGSYLADKKCLKTKEHEYAELNNSLQSQAEANDDHLHSLPPEEENAEEPYNECPICLELLVPDMGVIDGCSNSHKFHTDCLYTWGKDSKENCPICRESFAQALKNELEEYGRGVILSEPDDDPAFEEKFKENGIPVERGEDEIRILESVCEKIKGCISGFKGHRHYPGIFNDNQDNPEFYIPQDVVRYFETTRRGEHDPRSKGFKKHKTTLIRCVKKYLDSEVADEDIRPVLMSLLGVFCIEDTIMEYLFTELWRISSYDNKRQKIRENPMIFPALYASVTELPDDIGVDCIYHGFLNEAMNGREGNAMHFCVQSWLQSF